MFSSNEVKEVPFSYKHFSLLLEPNDCVAYSLCPDLLEEFRIEDRMEITFSQVHMIYEYTDRKILVPGGSLSWCGRAECFLFL